MPQEVQTAYDYDRYLERMAAELEPLCERCEDAQATEVIIAYFANDDDQHVCGNCYDLITEPNS